MTNNFEQSQGANSWAGMETYFSNSIRGNVTYDSTHQIGLSVGYNNLTNPQLLLQPTSILKNGASFTIPRLSNSFFTPVTYIGAFGDSSDWTSGWSNFMPDTIPTSVNFVSSLQMKLYPNPSNGKFVISSDEPILGVMVYNVMGQPLNSVWDELQSIVTISGGVSGVLLVRITTTSGTYTKRIINQ